VLVVGYYSLRLYVFNKINSYLVQKIEYKNLDIGFFPPSVQISNIKDFVIKDKNIVSFQRVSADIPLFSLFAKEKEINLTIHRPIVILDDALLKKKKKTPKRKLPFTINKVNIVDGELTYDTPALFLKLVNFNLYSFPRENATIYRLTSPHLRAVFSFSGDPVTIQGQMLGEFKEQQDSWKIGKFYWETEQQKININGRVKKDGRVMLNVFTQGSMRQLLDPLLNRLSIREFMYGNARFTRTKSGEISIDGNFNFNAFSIGEQPFKNMRGTINWDPKNKRILVDTTFEADGLATIAHIEKNGRTILINARNLPVKKLLAAVDIADIVPVGGVIKKGSVSIEGRQITGTAEIEQNSAYCPPTLFSAAGQIDFAVNTKTKEVSFAAKNLKTEFGKLNFLKGLSTPHNPTKLSIQLDASVDQAQLIEKYTGHYIKLPLSRWKLQGGNSTIRLDIKKVEKNFFIESDILLENFYSDEQSIRSLQGHISTKGDITLGTFNLDDPDLNGEFRINLDKHAGNLEIHFNNIRGEAKKMLDLLDINISLQGQMTGNFLFQDHKGMKVPLVTGSFQAREANFYDFLFQDLQGNLEYSDTVTLKDVKYLYKTGRGTADIFVDFPNKQFNITGQIDAIDLNELNNQFKGKTNLTFKGKGEFEKDPIGLTYQSSDIHFYQERPFKVSGEGNVYTDFSRFNLVTRGNIVAGSVTSPYTMQLNRDKGRFTGGYEARIRDINLLIPWGNNKGELLVKGEISGQNSADITTEGYAEFKGQVLSFPNFPHELKNFSGDLFFKGLDFTLRSITGTLGGGAVEGNGTLKIVNNRLDTLYIGLNGKNMTLYPLDRTTFTLDGNLAIKYLKETKRVLMSGTLNATSGIYEREIDEGVSFNTNASLASSGTNILDMLEFDLNLVGNSNMRIKNSFGDAMGKFNLKLIGTKNFPILLGVIESKQGKINFSGKKFDIINAKLTFNNKFRNDPQMRIESEAFIKNYRIKFNIYGSSSQPKPELISSPALPPRDILSLISVGELFHRPTSTELSTQIGTGPTGMIASELMEQIKKRTKKIFGNYMLKFEPSINSITGASLEDSSIIVGKEISKDFLIVYSTNFSTQRQQVIYLQYQISPGLSLIGMRNEDGRLSIDLRFRKRH